MKNKYSWCCLEILRENNYWGFSWLKSSNQVSYCGNQLDDEKKLKINSNVIVEWYWKWNGEFCWKWNLENETCHEIFVLRLIWIWKGIEDENKGKIEVFKEFFWDLNLKPKIFVQKIAKFSWNWKRNRKKPKFQLQSS